jgi:hypothetical protein
MVAFLKTILLLVFAVLLAAAGLLVPAHIRAVDQSVVTLAGARGASVEDKIWEAVNAAYTGPAQRIALATGTQHTTQHAHIQALLEKNPDFSITGGPDRNFEHFLQLSATPRRSTAVIPQLLPRSERACLSALLASSRNRNVTALLQIRDLNGLRRLHPASHAAGGPYDAGVLTLALLIEGGHILPGLAQQIGNLATLADGNNPAAVYACEELITATLSLGRQLDYRSLASLAQIATTSGDWAQMAELFRAHPARIAELYTALRFSEDPADLYAYLATRAESANADLDLALRHGPGAVTYLLQSEQPIHRPTSLPGTVLAAIAPYRPQNFVSITLANTSMGLLLKFLLLLLAGLAFAWAMGSAWRSSLSTATIAVSKTNPMVMARDVLISLVVVLTIWTFFEPEILQSQDSSFDAGPRIEFAAADTLQSLKSPVKAMQELNQVTLLVLALFFIIQLVIYSFCLIKLREVSKQKLSAALKIQLLENEENLFDFGLYVGLGGTVLSLILVAVGVVEASLMAAYASTLFGILFTALLKVMHLRPYRRGLIIQAGAPQEALNRSIDSVR